MILNNELKIYIENNILPKYERNGKGHQIDHINYVINRCFELCKNKDIDINMLYTIAAYHDIGYYIDYKNHEIISAQIMYGDKNLKSFFNEQQLKIMKEAIEDHRASLNRRPRSIYGELISSADRDIDVDESLRRIYLYSIEHFSELSETETIEECYNYTLKKFSKDGYANFFLEDKDYDNYLKELRNLLNNKEKFLKKLKTIISRDVALNNYLNRTNID